MFKQGIGSEKGSPTAMEQQEWLCLEESAFVGRVYDLAGPVHLGEHDYATLQAIAPDRAYVIDVDDRTSKLVRRFEALNSVYLMLAVETLPLETPIGVISREEWVRITLDVLLGRITSIRDCALLLVAETFELDLQPRDVTLNRLTRDSVITDGAIRRLLVEIADIGRQFRDERDRHLHRGEQRPLSDCPSTYSAASMIETWGAPPVGEDSHGRPIDLPRMHSQVVEEIRAQFTTVAHELRTRVTDLLDALRPIFEERWELKLRTSQLGLE